MNLSKRKLKSNNFTLISFRNVTKVYPRAVEALKNVSFDIEKGEFVCLAGKSGAGKTTLLKLLLGEERPTSGRIFFDGVEVQKIHPRDLPLLRRRIGAIFQDYKLLPSKTVYENVAYVLEVIGFEDEEIKKEVPQVLEIVGLSNCADHFPEELSGGERQRVAIARALITRPELICADEPTGNLDPYHTHDIIQLLLKIQELGATVILSTHDKEVINRLGKRVITLENGKIIRDEKKGRFIC
ncbi:cell division ATP-binding protein FtsE [bacterium]|nr:cell division ATP-binding protein FtsE [bacterium]